MTQQATTAEGQITSVLESWTDAVRRHDLPGIVAHHTPDILMFDLAPPLQVKGIDAYAETWGLFFQYHQPSQAFDIEELHGTTVGIVGYGEIGRAVAERAKPFGCRMLVLRRKPESSAGDPLVDGAYGPAQINEMLAVCDFVVAAAPSTPGTRGLVGQGRFR